MTCGCINHKQNQDTSVKTTSETRENALKEDQTYKLYCEKIHSSLIFKLERLGYTKEQIEHELYEENSQSKKSKENDIEL